MPTVVCFRLYGFCLPFANGFISEKNFIFTGCKKVDVTDTQRRTQRETENRNNALAGENRQPLDYSVEDAPIEWVNDTDFHNKYLFKSEIFR